MNKLYITITCLLLLFAHIDLSARAEGETDKAEGRKESYWKGFKRYDFKFNNKDARLIIPPKALPGKPWIWRARFPDWHTRADSLLVAEGFHLAYINTNNQFGSPEAVRTWDAFYAYLTEKYQLQDKAALLGVSRGGLFVYNWAKKNPDKVNCIYTEAPVCDFKSWPGGFGEGKGSPKDWNNLKKEYGFVSDSEAKAYRGNPIDSLDALARAKVPILHMISLRDKIVPVEENTMPLVNKYIRLGGVATVITCTGEPQKLDGHHFSIETPRKVADYIKYHSLPNLPLDASNYHQIEGGLLNSQLKFEREKKGRVAFLGGSITYNSGWRDSICNYLKKRFPLTEFEFVEAGISSMGTTPAAFRLERDVLSKGKIDLLFEEAAVNDACNGRTNTEQIRAMEGIVRHARMSNPEMDIVMMHFVDPDKMRDYNQGVEPQVIVNHNKVAEHYRIPAINLAEEVTDRINNGEFTWKDDFKNLHPSPFGQGVYAHSMIQFLENAFVGLINADDKVSAHALPDKIDAFAYDKGTLVDVANAKYRKGWHIDSAWKPNDNKGTRANYVDVPMLTAQQTSGVMKLDFAGTAIGIAVAAGPDAGRIEYRIDKTKWHQLNLFTQWSKQIHLPWYYTLSAELTPGKHLLEIRTCKENDEQSTGHACRIRYFFVNE